MIETALCFLLALRLKKWIQYPNCSDVRRITRVVWAPKRDLVTGGELA